MQQYSTPAFVLHSRAWRESSVLLDVFTRDFGLRRIAARGVKGKKNSALAAHLQCFQPLLIQYRVTRDWQQLIHADSAGSLIDLKGEKHLMGLYCGELLMRLLHIDDPHPPLFEHYLHSLLALSAATEDSDDSASVLRQFEWQLINELGYGFDWRYDCQGDALQDNKYYRLHDNAFWLVSQTNDYDFSGQCLLQLAEQKWQLYPAEAKRLLRVLLQNHLGDEPLQTRELWRQYEAVKRAARE